MAKRSAYRKAHGLDKETGFGGWTAKTDEELLGPAIELPQGEGAEEGIVGGKEEVVRREKRPPVRKWLGIW